jgi:maleate isomerase
MAPEGVAIHAARVPFGAMAAGGGMDPTIPLEPVRAFAAPPHVDDATELLAGAPLDAIAFGFTSSAYVIGPAGEAEMIRRLHGRSRGIPVVTACAASAEALRRIGARRLALVAPPWFDPELVRLGAAYYDAVGVDVVFAAAAELPSDQRAITPAGLHDWVATHIPDTADAVMIGGNGFRAVGTIAALEDTLGRPVLSANQVLLWAALQAAGAEPAQVEGYGRLFRIA